MNRYVERLILDADREMEKIGFFEHGLIHSEKVAGVTKEILLAAGYDDLAEHGYMAGIIHDIGNVFGRKDHHLTGSVLSRYVLDNLGYEEHEIALISEAIANHIHPIVEETSPMSSALLIADKVDLRRSRVRVERNGLNRNVTYSDFVIDKENRTFTFVVHFRDEILEEEFKDIYGLKLSMCEREAARLGYEFRYRLELDDGE